MRKSTTTRIPGSKRVVVALTTALVILSAGSGMAQNRDCPGDPGNDDIAGCDATGEPPNQNMDSGWIEISVKDLTPDGQVLIFNSVVDQVSGDPIFETVTLAP